MRLTLLGEVFAVSRLAPDAALPGWLPPRGLVSVTRSSKELSVVCAESWVPSGVQSERGWRCLELAGPIPFEMTGVLDGVLRPLAEARVPIFAFSTFDTDYVMVREADAAPAAEALGAAGHVVAQPDWQVVPAGPADLGHVRALFEEYWASFGFTPCFQNFSGEVASLPGAYSLALAWRSGEPAGCVAFRRFDARRAEAKRLFVRPQYRGSGIGGALLEWVILQARRAGYQDLVGDTMPVMRAALDMYERRGFEVTEAYSAVPTPGAVYLRLRL